jgi:hypothetical protein
MSAFGTKRMWRQRRYFSIIEPKSHNLQFGTDYRPYFGLTSYGENLPDFFSRAAFFVDKIFKGTNPGDIPVEQPTRFHLTINRKTADVLGLTIPSQLYIFADEVIE